MRILVVEDEASLAKQLTSSFAEAGYAVDHAADGERADFLAQTELYDAMVLDLGLPKIDGLTLLRKWREAGLRTPVLVLTARGSWHDKSRFFRGHCAGCTPYDPPVVEFDNAIGQMKITVVVRYDQNGFVPRLELWQQLGVEHFLEERILIGSPLIK